MKRFLKIALITVFAITMIVGCETEKKIKEASNEDIMKFVEAYCVANHVTDVTEYKTLYDFDFTYNALDSDGPKTSNWAIAEPDSIFNPVSFVKLCSCTTVDKNALTLINKSINELSSNEGYFAFDMDGSFSIHELAGLASGSEYKLSVYFKDFDGPIYDLEFNKNRDGVDFSMKEILTSIFGDGSDENPYKKVTYTVKKGENDWGNNPFVTIEGLTGTEEFKECAQNVASSFINFLWAEGDTDDKGVIFFQAVIKRLYGDHDNGYKGLNSYSISCESDETFKEDYVSFDKIEKPTSFLNAKVTENSGVPASTKEDEYLDPSEYLNYIIDCNIDADVNVSATLDGEDYAYTYSTADEILTINGKKYSCSGEKMSFIYGMIY